MSPYQLKGDFLDRSQVVKFGVNDVTKPNFAGYSWRFDVLEGDATVAQVIIHLTGNVKKVIEEDPKVKIDLSLLSCKRFVRWYRNPQERKQNEVYIHLDDYKDIIPSEKADKQSVRHCVMETIYGFYEEGVQFVGLFEILLSCDFRREDVDKALTWLTGKGWILPAADQGVYRLNHSKSGEFEEFLEATSAAHAPHRHFQEVPIDVTEPFVFVIMPFREDEFPQRIYKDVIKPLVQNDFKILCERVDEDHLSLNTLNKIYSHIVKCDFLIAETSTRNPNVFYELGLAHALEKDVIIIEYEKKLLEGKDTKYVFDTDKYLCHRYCDDDDLRDKLRKALIAHTRASKRG